MKMTVWNSSQSTWANRHGKSVHPINVRGVTQISLLYICLFDICVYMIYVNIHVNIHINRYCQWIFLIRLVTIYVVEHAYSIFFLTLSGWEIDQFETELANRLHLTNHSELDRLSFVSIMFSLHLSDCFCSLILQPKTPSTIVWTFVQVTNLILLHQSYLERSPVPHLAMIVWATDKELSVHMWADNFTPASDYFK